MASGAARLSFANDVGCQAATPAHVAPAAGMQLGPESQGTTAKKAVRMSQHRRVLTRRLPAHWYRRQRQRSWRRRCGPRRRRPRGRRRTPQWRCSRATTRQSWNPPGESSVASPDWFITDCLHVGMLSWNVVITQGSRILVSRKMLEMTPCTPTNPLRLRAPRAGTSGGRRRASSSRGRTPRGSPL